MKLLCFSSHNIWPFAGRTVSVCFQDGRYLIKAPIGSGKSFLFFDGPVFGIYKYSDRQMLSIKATEWFIKICFEHEGKIIVAIRDISRTKSWNDTVKSSLFVINDDIDGVDQKLSQYDVLERDKDIVAELMTKVSVEKIECKNETDVQATINTFIPAQEVFLSTSMLLQGSENVFELAPADRIALFKEIFGLMSIDSATDKINDERKAVSALLKSKKITDDVDVRLQNNINAIIQAWRTLSADYTDFHTRIDEFTLIADKISITNFSLDEKRDSIIHDIQASLTKEYNSIQQSLGALQAQHDQLHTLQQDLASTIKEWQSIAKQIANLEHDLQQSVTDDIASQKDARQHKYDTWLQSLPAERFIETHSTFPLVREHLQWLIQQGKLLAEQEKFLIATIDQLTTKQADDQHTLDSYSSQLDALQKDYDAKKKFECIKIDAECPFIEQINSGLFAWLKRNIATAEQTRNSYLEKITHANIPAQIKTKQDELTTIQQDLATLKSNPLTKHHKEITQAKIAYDTLLEEQQKLLNTEKEQAQQIAAREQRQKTLLQL